MTGKIENQTFDQERALYALKNTDVENCVFSGPEDGESAMKESRRINVRDCKFDLRYPLWHSHDFTLRNSVMTETCRAPLWYSSNGEISGMTINGVKCLRECDNIRMEKCTINSPEFGWRCRGVNMDDCDITSEYVFFESRDVTAKRLKLSGKYSFQYTRNVHIADSDFDTKDSFWHAENVRIENTSIKGEYFGWYSDGLTLVNCRIVGTQPFCYCRNLRLIDCYMDKSDLAFEYSDVDARVRSHIISVKNPRSGRIAAQSIGEIIRLDPVYDCDCEIVTEEN